MVQINVWNRLSQIERIYVHVKGWENNEEELEKILLKNATEIEKKVYQNMKNLKPEILRNFARDAIDKLNSDNWKIQAYGAGEIGAFEEISCYIGYWIEGIFNEVPPHRWLYADSKRVEFTEDQQKVMKDIDEKIKLCRDDHKLYEKIGKPVYYEYSIGREYMRREFEKLNIAFWKLN